MAEVTAMRNNALPYPIYGLPFVVTFVIRDADGDPVSPSSPDSEISKNGDTAADVNPGEATEISGLTGHCYLSLTGTEMTCDVAVIEVNSTGGKTPSIHLMPRKLPTVRAGTSASGGASTSTIVLDASASAIDDYYNGCVVAAVIDSTTEVRMITDYTGSNQTCTVVPDWNTAPDSNDTFTIYQPEGRVFSQSDLYGWKGTGAATVHSAGYPVVTVKDGTGTGEIDTTSGGVLVAAFANNSITAAAAAADFGAEIADAVWDEDATGHQTGGTFGQAIGDPGADTTTIYQSVVTDAAGTNIAADIIDIEGKVDDLETRLGTPSDLGSGATVAANLVDIESQTDDIGVAGAGLTNINLPDQTMNITGDITGNLSGSVGSVTGNVGGNVTGSVGSVAAGGIAAASFAAGAIDAAAIAANAIGASELAADAVTEIQNGLATATDLATVDTVVDAIKAKTDSLTFTVAGQVDSNIQYVNNVEVTGDGNVGSEWGPA